MHIILLTLVCVLAIIAIIKISGTYAVEEYKKQLRKEAEENELPTINY